MAYIRKTVDEWRVYGLYIHGWEEVTCEETYREGRERLKEYRENEPETRFRLICKRIPKVQV
jgi:hypothetical protein